MPGLWLAGQITGVEGYVESAATGLLVARDIIARAAGATPTTPPPETALGGLIRHLARRSPIDFQPANITWGLIECDPGLRDVRGRRERRARQAQLALARVRAWAAGDVTAVTPSERQS
jgi:methylenetetrahydrofolate--tRNA-(uracil-5-)-methyltransferase